MKRLVLAFLGAYKRYLSPHLPRACRFTPTCSEFAVLAIERYGFARGTVRAVARVLRCQPFHPGGIDLP